MQNGSWIRRAGWIALPAVLLLLAGGAVAEEPVSGLAGKPKMGPPHPTDPLRLPGAEPTHGAIVAHGVRVSDYWLGIECGPVPPALRAQLNLPEQQGLLVENVVPDSPAAKAGVKPFDILMKAGDKPLSVPSVLLQAVDAAKDKEMTLELVRGGKSLKIKAKPVERPKPGEGDWETLHKWLDQTRQRMEETRQQLEQMQPGLEMPPLRFRFFHPGAILPPDGAAPPALPGNTTVSISKKGEQPAKITVTRDNEKWEITENELDKLPADLRPHVERMLGRVAAAPGPAGRGESPKPPRAAPPDQPGAAPERRIEQRLERQMEQMNQRIEQLQKSIHEMRERLPKQMEDRIERMQKSIEELRQRTRDKMTPKPREENPGERRGI